MTKLRVKKDGFMRSRVSILNVLAVHSKVGHGTYFFKHFINRAVSMFMVCFGISSKLWCDNFAKKNNISNFTPSKFLNLYKHFVFGRLKRLVVPWWLTLFFWQATGVANKTSFLYRSVGLNPQSQLVSCIFQRMRHI